MQSMPTLVRNLYAANKAGRISGLADTAQGGNLYVKIIIYTSNLLSERVSLSVPVNKFLVNCKLEYVL